MIEADAEQVDAADNTCASLSHAGCVSAYIISGKETNRGLSWFCARANRNRHAFARLGVAADLRRSCAKRSLAFLSG